MTPAKPLIAVTSCHAYRDRADSIRETWGEVFTGRGLGL